MRILHAIDSSNPAGGGPIEVVLQSARVHTALGHMIELLSLDDPEAPWTKLDGLLCHALGPSTSGYGYSSRVVPWLERHGAEYDCVIVHGLWQYHGRAVQQVARRRGFRYFVFAHGMLDPWFRKAYPLKHLKKLAYWWLAERAVLRDAQATLFTTQEEARLADETFGAIPSRKVIVPIGTAQPPGDAAVQMECFHQQFPQLRGGRLLLFLARIHPKKGCDLLLDAFAAVLGATDYYLVMAGPDQLGLRKTLEARCTALGVADRVVWPGMLSGDAKWGALRAAEAFVLPSHQENFGVAVAEALSCGVPVLISNKVNIWREVRDAGAGIVAADTAAGTRELLERWLALPREEKSEMATRAAACFARHFEIGRVAQALLDAVAPSSDPKPKAVALAR